MFMFSTKIFYCILCIGCEWPVCIFAPLCVVPFRTSVPNRVRWGHAGLRPVQQCSGRHPEWAHHAAAHLCGSVRPVGQRQVLPAQETRGWALFTGTRLKLGKWPEKDILKHSLLMHSTYLPSFLAISELEMFNRTQFAASGVYLLVDESSYFFLRWDEDICRSAGGAFVPVFMAGCVIIAPAVRFRCACARLHRGPQACYRHLSQHPSTALCVLW